MPREGVLHFCEKGGEGEGGGGLRKILGGLRKILSLGAKRLEKITTAGSVSHPGEAKSVISIAFFWVSAE